MNPRREVLAMTSGAIDWVKEQPDLYAPSEAPVLVDVPELGFLMVDGHGDPNTAPAYRVAVEALYAVSYPIKFALQQHGGPKRKVGPLEGLWWADDAADFVSGDKASWSWTMMIRQPTEAGEVLDLARTKAAKKIASDVLDELRLESFDEGRSAQLLHRGPYAQEHASVMRLHDFIAAHDLRPTGRHHEIYLTDPNRTKPDRMRTVLRQPVA
jgi:hypothetical protein